MRYLSAMAIDSASPASLRGAPIGAPSTQIYGGQITNEDPNSSISPRKARGSVGERGAWEDMVCTDAEAAGIAKMWTSPLVEAKWDIEPASDNPKDEEVAEFVRWALFDRMRGSFKGLLKSLTEYTWRGFYLGEQVWIREIVDGQPRDVLDVIDTRPTRYVEGWEVDPDTGRLTGVKYSRITTGGSSVVTMPAERLTYLAMNRHANNFEGRSILRPCLAPWKVRKQVLKYAGIMVEKHAIPTPTVSLADGVSPDEISRIESMLMEYRVHERAYNIFAPGVEVDFPTPGTETAKYAMDVYHALGDEMVRAALTMNLRTGSEGKGSYSLYQGQEGLIRRLLAGEADYIAQELTHGDTAPVRRLVEWNFGRGVAIPKLTASNIAVVDPATLLESLSQATASGLLVPDDAVRAKVREIFGLPPEVEIIEPTTEEGAPIVEDAPTQASLLAEDGTRLSMRGRPLRPTELCLDLTGMIDGKAAKVDDAAKAIESATREALTGWLEDVQPLIEAGDAQAVASMPAPQIDTSTIADVFEAAAQQGAQDVSAEIRRQGGTIALADGDLDAAEIDAAMAAQVAASKAARATGEAVVTAAISQAEDVALGGNALGADALTEALAVAARRAAKDTARSGVGQLYGVGRLKQGSAITGDEPAKVEFSNSPSSMVCEACDAVDGETFVEGTPDFSTHYPPYSDCESTISGVNRCNCVYIWLV